MSKMKSVRIHEFGGPEVLSFDDIERPLAGDDDVVIEVHAASVNPVDFKIRNGRYHEVDPSMLPYGLGRDVSGTVVSAGPAAEALNVGDEVFAMLGLGRGGYSEYALVKASELAPKPRSVGHTQAAALPLAGLTAWQGLFDHGDLRPTQRVLIHGASGGVGHFAVQFAKDVGATVFATASAEDQTFVKELGAANVLDYRRQKFEQELGDIDLVFDLVGGKTQMRSFDVLREGGVLVSTLDEPSSEAAECKGVRALRYTVKPDGGQLARIGRMVDAGAVRVHVAATHSLDDAANAQRQLESTHIKGKLVLEVN